MEKPLGDFAPPHGKLGSFERIILRRVTPNEISETAGAYKIIRQLHIHTCGCAGVCGGVGVCVYAGIGEITIMKACAPVVCTRIMFIYTICDMQEK